MCGIVAAMNCKNCIDLVIASLKKLEYRGYDSAGISFINGDKLVTQKNEGRVEKLACNILQITDIEKATTAIGHTRWATHGAPSDSNCHPFYNTNKTMAIVHNGIIENYQPIKEFLLSHNYRFTSETDSEVIIHLIDYYYQLTQDLTIAFVVGVKALTGSFALCLLDSVNQQILAVRKDSPLIIGFGETTFVASDKSAIDEYASDFIYLSDYEFAIINKDKTIVTNMHGEIIKKEIFKEEKCCQDDNHNYQHYMLKEIFEQPQNIDLLIKKFYQNNQDLQQVATAISESENIYFIGCGSAYFASCFGKELLYQIIDKPLYCELASEFRYKRPRINENSLLIFASQSGETADTLAALRLAKKHRSKTVALVNVTTSALAKEADIVLPTYCGKEIAVASTKAYSAQVFNFILLYSLLSQDHMLKEAIDQFSSQLDQILLNHFAIEKLAYRLNPSQIFYIGRQLDYITCLEGALKLKEVAYATTYALAAGELKHGPLALVDKKTLVIAIICDENIINKTLSNILEVKARGASIILISPFTKLNKYSDNFIALPLTAKPLMNLLANLYLQLFAYYYALKLNVDIDKPRNLAKSVTVE